PSIVVTLLPATADTGVTHVRTAAPSRWTVQAPQSAIPHPYLVPVSPRVSRITHRSGISGGTSTCCRLPLTVNAIMTTSWTRVDAPQMTPASPRCQLPRESSVSEFFDSSHAADGVGSSLYDALHAPPAGGPARPPRRLGARARRRSLASRSPGPRRPDRNARPVARAARGVARDPGPGAGFARVEHRAAKPAPRSGSKVCRHAGRGPEPGGRAPRGDR